MTIPAYLFEDFYKVRSSFEISSIERICDSVIEIESFQGTPRTLPDAYLSHQPPYHGLIHPIKLPALKKYIPAALRKYSSIQLRSLAFRVRRKRFQIELFYLPPEDETAENSNSKINETSNGCGGSRKDGKLDF